MKVGAAWLMLNACVHYYSLLSLAFPVIFVINGASLILPNLSGRAMNMFNNIVGMAATIYSVTFLMGATLGSGVMSKLPENTFFPLAWVILVAVVVAITLLMLALRLDKPTN